MLFNGACSVVLEISIPTPLKQYSRVGANAKLSVLCTTVFWSSVLLYVQRDHHKDYIIMDEEQCCSTSTETTTRTISLGTRSNVALRPQRPQRPYHYGRGAMLLYVHRDHKDHIIMDEEQCCFTSTETTRTISLWTRSNVALRPQRPQGLYH